MTRMTYEQTAKILVNKLANATPTQAHANDIALWVLRIEENGRGISEEGINKILQLTKGMLEHKICLAEDSDNRADLELYKLVLKAINDEKKARRRK